MTHSFRLRYPGRNDSQPAAVIANYKAAYRRANGSEPDVTFFRGYYTIRGFRYRLTEVLRMTTSLQVPGTTPDGSPTTTTPVARIPMPPKLSPIKLSRQELINYYRSRIDHHEAILSRDPTEGRRKSSSQKVRRYRDEMMRWMFLPDDVFEAIADLVAVDEPAESNWHIIVYASEDDDEVISEHEDIPDSDLAPLLGSLRMKMHGRVYDEIEQARYSPDNEISITPIFFDDY